MWIVLRDEINFTVILKMLPRPFFDTLHVIYNPSDPPRPNDISTWSKIRFDRTVEPIIHNDATSVAEKEMSIFLELMNSDFQSALVVKYPSVMSGRSKKDLERAMDAWAKTLRTDVPSDWKLCYLVDDPPYRSNDWIHCDAYIVSRKGAEHIILQYQGFPNLDEPFQIFKFKS